MQNRRSFIASLIGAAMTPAAFLASASPAVAPVLWIDGGLIGAGTIIGASLYGIAEESQAAEFSVVRRDGRRLLDFRFNAMGGGLEYVATDGGVVFTREYPALVTTHEAVRGHIIWRPADGSDIVAIQIENGATQRLRR